MALLAVAPTVLIGCSGGSSSNSSTVTTRANLSLIGPNNAPFLEPINLRGVYKPQKFIEGSPDLSKGKGIYTFLFHQPSDPEGVRILASALVLNTSEEVRSLIFTRRTTTGFDGPVGTVYQYDTQDQFNVVLQRGYKNGMPPYGVAYESRSGTATVTAINGNYVTLELKNITMVDITSGTPEPDTFQINGTVTYNRNNIDPIDPYNNDGANALTKGLKNFGVPR